MNADFLEIMKREISRKLEVHRGLGRKLHWEIDSPHI